MESSDESVKHPVEPRARIPMLPPVLVCNFLHPVHCSFALKKLLTKAVLCRTKAWTHTLPHGSHSQQMPS